MVEPVVGADDQWALTPDDHALVMNKHRANRLGFAILLAFFRDRGRFPRDESEIEPQGIAALSRQLNGVVPVDGVSTAPPAHCLACRPVTNYRCRPLRAEVC